MQSSEPVSEVPSAVSPIKDFSEASLLTRVFYLPIMRRFHEARIVPGADSLDSPDAVRPTGNIRRKSEARFEGSATEMTLGEFNQGLVYGF